MNQPSPSPTLRLSLTSGLLPLEQSYANRFAWARAAGFEGVEIEAVEDRDDLERIRDASAKTGLIAHSVMAHAQWTYPLTSADGRIAALGIKSAIQTLENAHALGADTVLMISGLVGDDTSYTQAYTRSQDVIRREILPVAKELGVVIGIENVWNGFLLSPYEYVRFIDEFESPFVRPYLDVGNMVFGRPEDWVEIAGLRTVKLHAKDFRFDKKHGRFGWDEIGKGDVNWRRVRAALGAVGFSGWISSAEYKHAPFRRQLNRLVRRGQRLPVASGAFRKLRRRMVEQSLTAAAVRLRSHLQ